MYTVGSSALRHGGITQLVDGLVVGRAQCPCKRTGGINSGYLPDAGNDGKVRIRDSGGNTAAEFFYTTYAVDARRQRTQHPSRTPLRLPPFEFTATTTSIYLDMLDDPDDLVHAINVDMVSVKKSCTDYDTVGCTVASCPSLTYTKHGSGGSPYTYAAAVAACADAGDPTSSLAVARTQSDFEALSDLCGEPSGCWVGINLEQDLGTIPNSRYNVLARGESCSGLVDSGFTLTKAGTQITQREVYDQRMQCLYYLRTKSNIAGQYAPTDLDLRYFAVGTDGKCWGLPLTLGCSSRTADSAMHTMYFADALWHEVGGNVLSNEVRPHLLRWETPVPDVFANGDVAVVLTGADRGRLRPRSQDLTVQHAALCSRANPFPPPAPPSPPNMRSFLTQRSSLGNGQVDAMLVGWGRGYDGGDTSGTYTTNRHTNYLMLHAGQPLDDGQGTYTIAHNQGESRAEVPLFHTADFWASGVEVAVSTATRARSSSTANSLTDTPSPLRGGTMAATRTCVWALACWAVSDVRIYPMAVPDAMYVAPAPRHCRWCPFSYGAVLLAAGSSTQYVAASVRADRWHVHVQLSCTAVAVDGLVAELCAALRRRQLRAHQRPLEDAARRRPDACRMPSRSLGERRLVVANGHARRVRGPGHPATTAPRSST